MENKSLTLGNLKVFLAIDTYLQTFETEQLIAICFEIRIILVKFYMLTKIPLNLSSLRITVALKRRNQSTAEV